MFWMRYLRLGPEKISTVALVGSQSTKERLSFAPKPNPKRERIQPVLREIFVPDCSAGDSTGYRTVCIGVPTFDRDGRNDASK